MISTVSNELILRRLTTGDAAPVLVADFQQYSTAPRLSQLLSGRAEGHPVYQIDPVGVLSQDQLYVSLPELADACAQVFLSSGPPAGGPVVVVGHCSASALSLRVAGLLEQLGHKAAVILAGPAWPDEKHVRDRFAEFLDHLRAPQCPCPDLDGDPRDSVAQMEQALRDEIVAVALRSGLSGVPDAFAELLAWYRAWLAFLLACRNDLQATWETPTTAVTILAATVAAASVPGLGPDAYRVVEVPVLGQEKPITPELAEAVLAQFASR
jgi:hypothetical protein